MSARVLCFQFRGAILHQQELFPLSRLTVSRAASGSTPAFAICLPSAMAAAARAGNRARSARTDTGTGLPPPVCGHTPLSNTGINNTAKGTGA